MKTAMRTTRFSGRSLGLFVAGCPIALNIIRHYFSIAGLLLVAAASAQAEDHRVVTPSDDLRASFKLSPFYQKAVMVGDFPIVSSDKVSDYGLLEAAFVVEHMLAGRDDVRAALVKNKVRLAVMSPAELTCDIPEHSDLTPPAYWNRRARGLGSTRARPAVSCGEENLLALTGDPYQAESILVHEFGHAIHEMGLNSVDPTFDERLKAAFQASLDDGLWKGTYAATNRQEYWAEGVQSWFNTNRANDNQHNDVDTREKLRAYDTKLSALLEEAFPHNDWSYVKPTKRTEPAHLEGFDRSTAPKFAWPAEVQRLFDENEAKKKQKQKQSE